MSKVSKEIVSAVRMARWEEWIGLAKDMPDDQHIVSIEMLRPQRDETAVVLTVVRNHKVVQYELRGDVMGRNPKPVVSKQLAAASTKAEAAADDGGAVANGIALGEPPPKEPPLPGVIALGTALLTTTFQLGEQALEADEPKAE